MQGGFIKRTVRRCEGKTSITVRSPVSLHPGFGREDYDYSSERSDWLGFRIDIVL